MMSDESVGHGEPTNLGTDFCSRPERYARGRVSSGGVKVFEARDVQDKMNVVPRHPSEETQLHQGRDRTRGAGLDCEFDEPVHDELAAFEGPCALFHGV